MRATRHDAGDATIRLPAKNLANQPQTQHSVVLIQVSGVTVTDQIDAAVGFVSGNLARLRITA